MMEKKDKIKVKAAILKSDQTSCWMGLQATPTGIPGMLAAPACTQPVLILLCTMVGTHRVGAIRKENSQSTQPKRKQLSCSSDQNKIKS